MKLSAQEEYGLRCMLYMARAPEGTSRTIPEISRAEGLSIPNVAKLMRLLRIGGFVGSVRGQAGGYVLLRPADQVFISEVLSALGGDLYGGDFCQRHAGTQHECVHNSDCSIRSLWSTVQRVVEGVLGRTTLKELLCAEDQMHGWLAGIHPAPAQAAVIGGAIITDDVGQAVSPARAG